jgi:predicted acylesterase/phospholipase RssA
MMRNLRSIGHLVLVMVATIALAACGTIPPHQSVPEEHISEARLEGFPTSIRFWADEAPDNLEALVKTRIEAYRMAHAGYFERHGRYPPLHYLAISGGAYDGAFGAGMMAGWSATGKRPDFAIVTGVSTGALIAPFVFIGQEYDQTLRELYTKTSSQNIFLVGVMNILDGLTGGLSVTDSGPLEKKIRETITPKIIAKVAAEHRKGKRLFIGTTNIEAQRGVIWDIGEIANSKHPKARELIHQIMLASAAIPGLFRPVFINVQVGEKTYSEIHVDGGVISQVFIYPLKLKRGIVEAFKQHKLERKLYIIRNSKITPEYKSLTPGFYSLAIRSMESLTKYHGVGDLYRLYVGSQRDGIDYNLMCIPESFNAEPQELFDPAYMSALYDKGYEIGQNPEWMKAPPGVLYSP